MEVVCRLDTDSFIMAPVSFVGRRVAARVTSSDNGTNFVGSVSEMKVSIIRPNRKKTGNCLQAKDI